VIDISAHTTVSDFRLVRASNILAVIHKASEGDFYADPMCAARRPQAEAAGLLWGTYHFGKGDSPGEQQAAFFLDSSRPIPGTLLALDLEANEGDPSNTMTLEQTEAFVQAVASATGLLPLVYVHPTWANARITPDSILTRCGRWVVDYHDSPEIPLAWATSGWRLWQYAGDVHAGRRARPPHDDRPGPRPMRSQLVQWRRGRALPVLECRRLIKGNGAQGAACNNYGHPERSAGSSVEAVVDSRVLSQCRLTPDQAHEGLAEIVLASTAD